jgi:hypothetical protein
VALELVGLKLVALVVAAVEVVITELQTAAQEQQIKGLQGQVQYQVMVVVLVVVLDKQVEQLLHLLLLEMAVMVSLVQ